VTTGLDPNVLALLAQADDEAEEYTGRLLAAATAMDRLREWLDGLRSEASSAGVDTHLAEAAAQAVGAHPDTTHFVVASETAAEFRPATSEERDELPTPAP
jgi:hypothetical protein